MTQDDREINEKANAPDAFAQEAEANTHAQAHALAHKDDDKDKNKDAVKHGKDGSTEKDGKKEDKPDKKEKPAGGFDTTALHPARGKTYTLRITFHSASHLPIGDQATGSSDPFVLAQANADVATRHKQDPPVRFRTPTVHGSLEPRWESVWVLAGVPASGLTVKARVYDEDNGTHDDRLGTVHILTGPLKEGFKLGADGGGQVYELKRRGASWRAWGAKMCFGAVSEHARGDATLAVSIEVLGPTQDECGKLYTVCSFWSIHYSPIMGRVVGTTARTDGDEAATFQAGQLQLTGPVPNELYHRYVDFKPFVGGMFKGTGPRGTVLHAALHRQHEQVYHYDHKTEYGTLPGPGEDMARRFLDMTHWGEGDRIFTYVITLDGLIRFTETGKEFAIDMLSKHTMHSDVNIYIAVSGEFFIRPYKEGSSGEGSGVDTSAPSHSVLKAAEEKSERENTDNNSSRQDHANNVSATSGNANANFNNANVHANRNTHPNADPKANPSESIDDDDTASIATSHRRESYETATEGHMDDDPDDRSGTTTPTPRGKSQSLPLTGADGQNYNQTQNQPSNANVTASHAAAGHTAAADDATAGITQHTPGGKNTGRDHVTAEKPMLAASTTHADTGSGGSATPNGTAKARPTDPKAPKHTTALEGAASTQRPTSPSAYELVIDNDSGTYRPDKKVLPLLQKFLEAQFGGLHVVCMSSDDDKLQDLKKARRERKQNKAKEGGSGGRVFAASASDLSSIASSRGSMDDGGGPSVLRGTKEKGLDFMVDPGSAKEKAGEKVKGVFHHGGGGEKSDA